MPGSRRAAWLLHAEKRSGTLGGGLSVAAVRGEAAPGPQARITAPYRPRCSLDQRTAGQYLGGLGTPVAMVGCEIELLNVGH